ncbi:hypothetical protein NDU88_005966 [Pleurodeles waltl]|uniref:Uncharacterized protein n=1 Tax=Pleurodeles waltl TaxID=8319 RepID=A0AAV7VNM5_PLEWA|nr:hypothetical protein NDU88_005966 [Pleurodeles waltl]
MEPLTAFDGERRLLLPALVFFPRSSGSRPALNATTCSATQLVLTLPPEGNAQCCPTGPMELQGGVRPTCGPTRAACANQEVEGFAETPSERNKAGRETEWGTPSEEEEEDAKSRTEGIDPQRIEEVSAIVAERTRGPESPQEPT